MKTIGLLSLLAMFFSCSATATPINEPLSPLPLRLNLDPQVVKLGDKLFHDKQLSLDNTVSCASCHSLKKGGTDQAPTSTGINEQLGPINSPTVFNSRFNSKQFWDGRAKDLHEQAAGPVENPKEMGANWALVVKRIQADPTYQKSFAKHYQGKITKKTIIDAIVTFEKSLVTPSRFDDYLRGNTKAITTQEKKGYETFKSVGCTACHSGTNVGGVLFMKMGLVKNYFTDRGGKLTEADLGRFNVTKRPEDKFVFKVPTLRNVALTFPYFHDGSVTSLPKAVDKMALYQLGRTLTQQQTQDIVAFLKSLTGKTLE